MFLIFLLVAVNFLISGVVVCILGKRSREGLALSQLWGLRTKRTMVNAETFAKANKAIWRSYMFQGYVSFIAGIAILIAGIIDSENPIPLVVIAITSTVIILAVAFYGHVKGHKAIQ